MKTTIITIAIAILFSVSAFASEPVVLTNEMATENGTKKEYTMFVADSTTPSKLLVQCFDNDGKLTERVTYKWSSFDGWIPATKMEYSYQNENILAEMACTKWDNKNNNWETKTLVTQYGEDNAGHVYMASK